MREEESCPAEDFDMEGGGTLTAVGEYHRKDMIRAGRERSEYY